MIAEMTPLGVELTVGFLVGFFGGLLADFLDDFLDDFLVCSLLDLGLVGDLVKIFVDFPVCRRCFWLFIRIRVWFCFSMSSLSCRAGRRKGLAPFDTGGVVTVLVTFCNLTVLTLFLLCVKAWGKMQSSMIVSPVVWNKLEPEINVWTTPLKEQLGHH